MDHVIYSPYATEIKSYSSQGFKELFDENNKEPRYRARARMIYNKLILDAMRKNKIVEPEGFSNLNYKDTLSIKYTANVNYYANRGFIKPVTTSFSSEASVNANPASFDSSYSPFGSGKIAVFPAYVRLAMYKSEEAVKADYGNFPLVMEKYYQTVKHMKENYGIDLPGIAVRY